MSIKYTVNITRLDLPSVSASLTLYTTSHLLLPTSCPLNSMFMVVCFIFLLFPPLSVSTLTDRVLQSLGILELKGKEDL